MISRKLFLPLAFFLILTPLFAANDTVPVGLQKIIDFNNQYLNDFSLKISLFIAFVAGMLGVLSPCILPILPAYFAFTFKEKKNITKMTLVFFLGFATVFVGMGIIAGFVGQQTLIFFQSSTVTIIAGILLAGLGLLTISGKGLVSFIKLKKNYGNDVPGVFLSGSAFALGWTACLGPVLAGILGMGALTGSVAMSALLMFFYAFGNLVPLFLLSVFYDKLKLSKTSFIKGKSFDLVINGVKHEIHSTNLISGLLLIILGGAMMVFNGTGFINSLDLLGTKQFFYSLQDSLLNWGYAGIFSAIVFLLFIALLIVFFWRGGKKK